VPHVAQNIRGRRSAIDGRTTRHPGYAVSQRIRKRIEEVFGLDKDGRRPKEDAISRPATCAMGLHLRHGGLQFDPSP